MLETFKARLKAKAKAAGANLSQKRIDAQADRLHKKFPELTEEADHDEKIDGLYDDADFKEMASMDDYQRAKEAREKKEKEQKAQSGSESETGTSKEQQQGDDMPSWFKPFAGVITGMQKEKTEKSMRDKIKGSDKLKDIPETFYRKWQLPEKDEEIDAFADVVKSEYEAHNKQVSGAQQEEANNSFSQAPKPPGSAGGGNNKVDPAIKAAFDKKKPNSVTK